MGRKILLDGDVAADVTDAQTAIARLNSESIAPADTEALARMLLRAESVASSRIAGLVVGARKLLRVEAANKLSEKVADVTATEVLAHIDAVANTVRSIEVGETLTLEHLLEFHRRLFIGGRQKDYAGLIRTEQNWIGGSDYNPCSARYVPPPPEFVHDLLDDLCAFCNDDSLPVVAQAAIAHAQFENIRPFADGNGRTGRALIHLVLRRRGLSSRVLPPVSLVLATWARDYFGGLTATQYQGNATSPQAHEGLNLWMGRFAGACLRAVQDATWFEDRVEKLQAQWRVRLGVVRAESATDLLLHVLVGAPVLSVSSTATLIDRSFPQTNQAIARLVEAGIIKQVAVGRRNRAFEAPEVIAAFTDLERQLASGDGDTRVTPPSRPVPRRRQ
jgi:Fic family protein